MNNSAKSLSNCRLQTLGFTDTHSGLDLSLDQSPDTARLLAARYAQRHSIVFYDQDSHGAVR